MQDKSKGYVAAILIIIFLAYAAVQLTCNALAPDKPAVKYEKKSR